MLLTLPQQRRKTVADTDNVFGEGILSRLRQRSQDTEGARGRSRVYSLHSRLEVDFVQV